ncbi:MAG: VCBS repeat-containing protein, partial [Gemmatimonadetes bacterium]|nr:VCBS repeat-containing protein [Gemmatimonadota bacterium]
MVTGRTWGSVAEDLDGDGLPELLVGRHFGVPVLFWNRPGQFVADTAAVFTTAQDLHGVLVADFNGDGHPDLLGSQGGDGGSGRASLENELWWGGPGGAFRRAEDLGDLADPAGRGRSFSASDVDGDGDLDVFHAKAPLRRSRGCLYRNDGGTFTDISVSWGLGAVEHATGALFADWDNDGDPDLLIGGEEFGTPTTLYRNDGMSFVDVTAAWMPDPPAVAGAAWGDYDEDGDPDLAVVQGDSGVFDTWSLQDGHLRFWFHHRGGENGADTLRFRALPGGVLALHHRDAPPLDDVLLEDVSPDEARHGVLLEEGEVRVTLRRPGGSAEFVLSVTAPADSWGNVSGSVRGVAAASAEGLETPVRAWRTPRLYRNDGTSLVDVTAESGFAPAVNARAVSWVDFDLDGDLDLHVVNKGDAAVGNEQDHLYERVAGTFRRVGDRESPQGGGTARGLSDGAVWAVFRGEGYEAWSAEGAGPAFFAEAAVSRFRSTPG